MNCPPGFRKRDPAESQFGTRRQPRNRDEIAAGTRKNRTHGAMCLATAAAPSGSGDALYVHGERHNWPGRFRDFVGERP
jgi:hypothetical protein